jgi:hypothetical protein
MATDSTKFTMLLLYGNKTTAHSFNRIITEKKILAYFLSESSDGTIRRINYSQPQRDSHMAVPIDQVENWYRAVKKFYDLALDPLYLITFKLQPGNVPYYQNDLNFLIILSLDNRTFSQEKW